MESPLSQPSEIISFRFLHATRVYILRGLPGTPYTGMVHDDTWIQFRAYSTSFHESFSSDGIYDNEPRTFLILPFFAFPTRSRLYARFSLPGQHGLSLILSMNRNLRMVHVLITNRTVF